MVPNRNNISLYQDAKGSLKSLIWQSGIVFVGFIVMLLLTGGKPSGLIVGLSFVVGVGFVAWSEATRLNELDTSIAKPSTLEKLLRSLKLNESRISVNKKAILRVLLSKNISYKQLQRLTLDVVKADVDNRFVLLAEIAGLSLTEDFNNANLSGADLINANLNYANLSGANLSGADLINANLNYANFIEANLNYANLFDANLSYANLSYAYLIKANLTGANLSAAIVENARFRDNIGIDETLKQDLIKRGAIFIDSPGERSNIKTLR